MVANDPLGGLVLILVLLAIILTDRRLIGHRVRDFQPRKAPPEARERAKAGRTAA